MACFFCIYHFTHKRTDKGAEDYPDGANKDKPGNESYVCAPHSILASSCLVGEYGGCYIIYHHAYQHHYAQNDGERYHEWMWKDDGTKHHAYKTKGCAWQHGEHRTGNPNDLQQG